ncbi:SDR family NAD(P)-dependent oxidoreductase [Ruegeria sp.]|uniref:SDR family NAD(P)-dependent oxidoreductase n=1 Tax=Ruegeria sp. TaxID=1879320 RepID=UPI002322C09D|nr:SDR family NAD(P)-dependent oxidoreductase [Ruegeria sp.]MDA7963641.1 SDR family oxidoreductase [Ruegeria sp.]
MVYMEKFRLDGKTAVLTGASRGLGRVMALAMAEAGADVIITGRTEESLAKTAKDIRAHGGRKVDTVALDMSEPEACQAGFEHIRDTFGPVDILVNNVGNRLNADSIVDQSLTSWQKTIDTNLTSCFLGSKILGSAMIERGTGGRIISISSMNAFVSNRGIGDRAYETSKAAVLQFTKAAAADWAPHGVTVNAICPGLFMTDANREWNRTRPEVIEKLVSGIPMGRAGEPDEIGALAVFLASDASSYMTGAGVVFDGGYTLW